jgi:hypothetical protein
MKRLIISLFILIAITFQLLSQIPNNTWRDHFSYTTGISIAKSSDKIYCASYGGISILDLTDNSIRKLSKVNGLSDVDISKIKYAIDENILIVMYKNGNIDIIEDNLITNLTDIKRKTTIGNKSINSIEIIDGLAYLSTGFGIVVLDYIKKEIKDTYFFGPGGTNIIVNDVTSDNEFLYAATTEGVYRANLNNNLLVDYNNWSLISDKLNYSHIQNNNGKIYVVHYNRIDGVPDDDNLYELDNDSWSLSDFDQQGPINGLHSYENYLYVIYYGRIARFDVNSKTNIDYWSGIPFEAFIVNENELWAADNFWTCTFF